MKTSAKIITAAFLALSAVAPAFAAEENTLIERNTYLYAADARPIVQPAQVNTVRAHRGVEAMAFAPANVDTRDYGIGSQR